MSTTWRMAGLNYVNYSIIASRVLRKSLKSAFREEAEKREVQHAKCYFWVDGKILPYGEKPKHAEASKS